MVALGITGKPEDLEKMLAAVTPPEVITDENGQVLKRGDCVTENLSTYCIAMAGIEEYAKLKDAMVDARNKAVAEVGQRFETLTKKNPQDANNPDVQFEQNKIIRPGGVPLVGGIADIFRGQQNLQSYGEKINRIDRELDLARQALDQGLAAYSELQMSLPMHYKLKDMMKKLEAYRDKISDVRRQVELYPSSFLDVTTTQCT